MSKLIIPIKPILIMFACLAMVALVQGAYYENTKSREIVWRGSCLYQEWGKDDNGEILMKVKCEDGNNADLRSSDAFLSVLQGKTNEFQCERQKNEKTSCVPKDAQK